MSAVKRFIAVMDGVSFMQTTIFTRRILSTLSTGHMPPRVSERADATCSHTRSE
jgi:hypothetical protein